MATDNKSRVTKETAAELGIPVVDLPLIQSCADCKHMKSWMEYGNVIVDCCHKEGSSYYEQYADENLDAGPHCPYWEKFDMGDVNPWGGEYGNDEHA